MKIVAIRQEAFEELIRRIKNLENRYAIVKEELLKDRLYTPNEVQQILKVGRDTLQRYRDSGRLPAIKIGKKIRYRWADIQKLMNS